MERESQEKVFKGPNHHVTTHLSPRLQSYLDLSNLYSPVFTVQRILMTTLSSTNERLKKKGLRHEEFQPGLPFRILIPAVKKIRNYLRR